MRSPGASRCDGCGEVVTDLDAGFSPGLHAMAHACGGTWRPVDLRLAEEHAEEGGDGQQ